MRYLVYSGFSGLAASGAALEYAVLDPERLPSGWMLAALVLLSLGCAGRSAWLALHSGDYERLTPWERQDLDRRLCPGMIRSDVVDDLAGRGWRIGKIRTVLESFRPA